MAAGTRWSQEETQMAFALYFMIPVTEIDRKKGDVADFASAIGRTTRAAAMKLWNIASLDENRQRLGRSGLKNASALDKQAWELYRKHGDSFLQAGLEMLCEAVTARQAESFVTYAMIDIKEGRDLKQEVTKRVNQEYFRNTLLEIYKKRCCITGLSIPQLLVASHIKPWSIADPKTERLNPSNGLLLNALHDRAFDKGFITIDKHYRVVVSRVVKDVSPNREMLLAYDGAKIELPEYAMPRMDFIEYHNDVVFIR